MDEKTQMLNAFLKEYFRKNESVNLIPAKDLMPEFIKAGIFEKDEKNGLPIRKILRRLDSKNALHLIPYVYAERKNRNTFWYFQRSGKIDLQVSVTKSIAKPAKPTVKKNRDRDEDYVLNLCDAVLNLKGLRQHRFDFLRGDAGTRLPVDIFYPDLNLVVEYREYQHTNPVKHFDKPHVITVSGVHRGEQRKLYDQRRRDVLPQQGIKLVEISYTDFVHSGRNKIMRDEKRDLKVVERLLGENT